MPEHTLKTSVAPVESTYTVEGALILANDLARTKHENAELRRSRQFIEQWYAERVERISDLAKEHGIWNEVACVLANGTTSAAEPPTYAQLLNGERHKVARLTKERDRAIDDYDRAVEEARVFRRALVEIRDYTDPGVDPPNVNVRAAVYNTAKQAIQ